MRKKTFSILILIFNQCILFTVTIFSQDDSMHLPFELTGDGHTMIKATINGVEGNFIFDTGAGLNMLTKTFADSVSNLEKQMVFIPVFRPQDPELEARIKEVSPNFTSHTAMWKQCW